ncbi:MAG: hypothetical protein K1X89_28250 [Myxococcaceae bacterium]|nr:hypothetical protein [Myxococcaceae bacterium]
MPLLALLAVVLTHTPMPPPPRDAGMAQVVTPSGAELEAASVKGKYRTLLMALEVKEDGATYGEVKDYGFWSGTEYRGHAVPPGHWVYLHPRWYIWRDKTAPTAKPPTAREQEAATMGGKYSGLLHVLLVPEDQAGYGEVHDYGYSASTSYREYAALTPGYWVYVAPRWYVFARSTADKTWPRPPPTVTPSFGLSEGAKPSSVKGSGPPGRGP